MSDEEINSLVAKASSLDVLWSISALAFPCGAGEVRVSFADGSVTFKNCAPPAAAQAFWEQVTKAFPAFRQAIIEGKA